MVPEHIVQRLARATDRQKASVGVFSDIVRGLKGLCQGVHIITIGGEKRLKTYLDAAKLS
jgi:5,10-methylenetetrahydrofolate reductase